MAFNVRCKRCGGPFNKRGTCDCWKVQLSENLAAGANIEAAQEWHERAADEEASGWPGDLPAPMATSE